MLLELPCDADGQQAVDVRRIHLVHYAPDLLIAVWVCPGPCRRRVWHAFPLARWPEVLRVCGVAVVYRPAVLIDATVAAFRDQLADLDDHVAGWDLS